MRAFAKDEGRERGLGGMAENMQQRHRLEDGSSREGRPQGNWTRSFTAPGSQLRFFPALKTFPLQVAQGPLDSSIRSHGFPSSASRSEVWWGGRCHLSVRKLPRLMATHAHRMGPSIQHHLPHTGLSRKTAAGRSQVLSALSIPLQLRFFSARVSAM